ncbi:MAG: hypothetical protein WB592_01035 [Acidimicrobiales bacterium]
MHPDFDHIVEELYGLPPAEFTSKRDAYASQARRSGEQGLAASIKSLKRPTTSAWLANRLVRERRQKVVSLIELGAALRQAQASLAGGELRRLSQQRRQVVSDLAKAARQLAIDLGQQVSAATDAELETTLEVALADPSAGDTLLSGRLTAALKPSVLGSLDVTREGAPPGRVGGDTTSDTRRRHRGGALGGEPQDSPPSRRHLEAAERTEREAADAASAAKAEVDEHARREGAALNEQQRLRQAVHEAAVQLEALRALEAEAAREMREARRDRAAAERAAKAAEQRLTKARRALGRSGD